MGLTAFIIEHAIRIIEAIGYTGVFILMVTESMVFPTPSEAVMPFAGFLWYEGRMSFLGIAIASTLGSIVGSLASYYLGAYGGRPVLKRYGKYLMLNEHHLKMTEDFFAKYGEKTIFISRFVPVVRHLISIPAGIGKMNVVKFCIYTTIGAFLWNSFLTYAGFKMAENWLEIRKYFELVDVFVVIALAGVVLYAFYRIWKVRNNNAVSE